MLTKHFFFFCVAFLELWPWKDKKRPLLLRYFVMALSQNWPLSRNFFCTNTNTETFNALFSKTHKVKYKCTLVMKIQIQFFRTKMWPLKEANQAGISNTYFLQFIDSKTAKFGKYWFYRTFKRTKWEKIYVEK